MVTLDVDMPRMDGLTALGEMVSKHRTPVVMLKFAHIKRGSIDDSSVREREPSISYANRLVLHKSNRWPAN